VAHTLFKTIIHRAAGVARNKTTLAIDKISNIDQKNMEGKKPVIRKF